MIETDVPVVFWLAHATGGVKLILVLDDWLQTVRLALPHFAMIVCVKLVDFLVTVSVCAVPSVPLPTLNSLLRGILFRLKLPDPVQFTVE